MAGREDLIGFGPKCLIRPRTGNGARALQKAYSHDSGKGRTAERMRFGGAQQERRGTDGGRTKKKKTIRNVHKKKT